MPRRNDLLGAFDRGQSSRAVLPLNAPVTTDSGAQIPTVPDFNTLSNRVPGAGLGRPGPGPAWPPQASCTGTPGAWKRLRHAAPPGPWENHSLGAKAPASPPTPRHARSPMSRSPSCPSVATELESRDRRTAIPRPDGFAILQPSVIANPYGQSERIGQPRLLSIPLSSPQGTLLGRPSPGPASATDVRGGREHLPASSTGRQSVSAGPS